MIRAKKRGQEEIIGFVLIVVIVAIIFLVFLGISIRQKSPITQRESGDVAQFIDSLMDYTSECTTSSELAYLDVGGLIKECYSDSSCKSGRSACDVLTKTVQGAIEANWKIGADRPIKGYLFNVSYSSESVKNNILMMQKGVCANERIGAEHLLPAYPGNIRSSLNICY